MSRLQQALAAVVGGRSLERAEVRAVFSGALADNAGVVEATDALASAVRLGALLAAMAQRGETRDEIAGVAEALRAAAVPFVHPFPDAIDTCGTGGDGLGTFNLSTAAAIVAAAAGARVVKHGNRAVSSRCGSADLLECAGVVLELPPDAARAVLEEVGVTFLFAPHYHPAMAVAAPVRRVLGLRTVFNLVGPLCNPGAVRRQVLGLGVADRLHDVAAVLDSLGHERAYVVHGGGGADELTLQPGNHVARVGDAPDVSWEAATLGFNEAPVAALAGGDVATNLQLLHAVLAGRAGPLLDATVLNASAALVVSGLEDEPRRAVDRARAAIERGDAADTFARWITTSQALAGARP